MSGISFKSTLKSCVLVRSAYSNLFNGIPDSFKFSRAGKELLFLSSGALYSHALGPSSDVDWKRLCASGRTRDLSRYRTSCSLTTRSKVKYHKSSNNYSSALV